MNTKESPLLAHLIELRARLIRSLATVLVIFIALIPFNGKIYDFLARPMVAALPMGSTMIATGITTPFFIPIKVTLLAALLLALPYLLYQAWGFVAPGLYRHEKRLVMPLIISSFSFFILGMLFCYFVVFRIVFSAIIRYKPDSITVAPDISEYLNFVMTLFLAFGLAFEVPVVVVVLVRIGMVSVATLRKIRPYVIVGSFIIAAVVTPPDVISQLLLAVPMVILYELGLLVARWIKPSPNAEEKK